MKVHLFPVLFLALALTSWVACAGEDTPVTTDNPAAEIGDDVAVEVTPDAVVGEEVTIVPDVTPEEGVVVGDEGVSIDPIVGEEVTPEVEVEVCTPNCGTKVCGDDGCQGLCGTCDDPTKPAPCSVTVVRPAIGPWSGDSDRTAGGTSVSGDAAGSAAGSAATSAAGSGTGSGARSRTGSGARSTDGSAAATRSAATARSWTASNGTSGAPAGTALPQAARRASKDKAQASLRSPRARSARG